MEVDSAVLVHVLSRIEYEMQHIPGSINIPITEMALTDRLPGQLDRPLIFYCMGER
jgi:rhodanese-related sulfurtransferase